MTTGTRPRPSCSPISPKVKRGLPVTISWPMRLRKIPAPAINSPLRIEPCVRYMSRERPRHMSEKYSAGPNLTANLARGSAMNIKPTRPIVPAMKEPNAAMPRAGPALP